MRQPIRQVLQQCSDMERERVPPEMPRAAGQASGRSGQVLRWLFGTTVLGLVVYFVVHFSAAAEFVHLAQHSHPSWLLLALALQAGTYSAEGAMWRAAAKAGHQHISGRDAYCMSVAKLAVDQAVPIGGVGGNILFVQGLGRGGVSLETALAGVVTTTFSYYVCYAICLALALVLAALARVHARLILIAIGIALILLSSALAVVVLLQPGAAPRSLAARIAGLPVLRRVLQPLQRGDASIAHSRALLTRSTLLQLLIVALDSATLWACLRAVGARVPLESTFVAFMFISILQVVNISPNGVGTFEAAAVLMLRSLGIASSAALSATLLFRGLSLALPMIPGVIYMKRLASPSSAGLAGPERHEGASGSEL